MAISTVSVGGATKGSQINEIIGVLNGTNSAPTVPAATGTAMWFHQDTAPVEWSIDGNPGDDLLAVKGGSKAYDAAGGTGAGTWTVAGLTKDAHTHTGPEHNHKWGYSAADNGLQTYASDGVTPLEFADDFSQKLGDGDNVMPLESKTASTNFYTVKGGTGVTGAQSDAGISSAGTWRPKARLGIICTKD